MAEVRGIFDKAATIDNITTISGKDLDIGKEGQPCCGVVCLRAEIHLVGPAYLVMKYEGSSK